MIVDRLIPRLMTADEARECIFQIKQQVSEFRRLVYDLDKRRGWEALGYRSWHECVMTEFDNNERYLYNVLYAAQIEANIYSTEQIGQIPERHLRPLQDVESEDQREVWQRALDTAPDGKMTSAHVKQTVDEYQRERGHTSRLINEVKHLMNKATLPFAADSEWQFTPEVKEIIKSLRLIEFQLIPQIAKLFELGKASPEGEAFIRRLMQDVGQKLMISGEQNGETHD